MQVHGKGYTGGQTSLHGQLYILQFAYKVQRGTEDATLTLLHMITKHIQHREA